MRWRSIGAGLAIAAATVAAAPAAGQVLYAASFRGNAIEGRENGDSVLGFTVKNVKGREERRP